MMCLWVSYCTRKKDDFFYILKGSQMYGSGIRIRTNTGYNPISADLRGARGGAGNDEILPQHWMIRCLGLKQKPSNTIRQSN